MIELQNHEYPQVFKWRKPSFKVWFDLQAVIVHQKQTLQLAPSISTIFAGAKPPRTST